MRFRRGARMAITVPWSGTPGPILSVARDALGGNFMQRRIRSGGRVLVRGRGLRRMARVRGGGFIPL